MSNLLLIIVGGVLVNNFVMSQFLGICPFLGVSKKTETALGMGMAVTFVIGNANRMPTSLFSPGTSIASTLANEFGEAADFHLSTLFALGFLLFVITFVVLSAAKIMLLRAEKAKGL